MSPTITATTGSVKTVENKREDHASVFEQLRDFRSQLPKDLLAKWETPAGFKTFQYLAEDWGLIFLGYILYARQPSAVTFCLALFFMAWGQKGLSNISHDSIHRNLITGKEANNLLANVFTASPMMTTADIQRKVHTAHHHNLGTKDDPNHGVHNETSLRHYRNGCFDHKTIVSLWIYDVCDPILFFNHSIGALREAPVHLTGYWAIVTLLFGPQFTFLFHLARCTLTYVCYILREIFDHSGLPSTTIFDFSRNSPCCNAFQKFIHPHDDNYHLLHHLLPRVPMSRLHECHMWLVDNIPAYKKANNNMSYFNGESPLFVQPIHTFSD